MPEKKEQANQIKSSIEQEKSKEKKGSPLWFKTLICIILAPKIFMAIGVLLGYYTFMTLYCLGAIFAYIVVYYILLKVRKKLTTWDYVLVVIVTLLL